MKKVAVFTGTRADYGILSPLLFELQQHSDYQLQLIVSGTHLSPEYGMTVQSIEDDGFAIAEKVEMLLSTDTSVGMAKSLGLGVISFSDTLVRLAPELLLVLGDRYEALAITQAAFCLDLPVAHLHGGEKTQGAKDDCFRHAITKLSTLHFTATNAYRQRVIQLGESPSKVFNVGAPGLDFIANNTLLNQVQLKEKYSFDFSQPFILLSVHPETSADNTNNHHLIDCLIETLGRIADLRIVTTYSNADPGGRALTKKLQAFKNQSGDNVFIHPSLGQLNYLSVMQYAKFIIGNSSSGIIEAPSLGVPTVNVGDRQKGRVCGASVFHADLEEHSILSAIKKAQQYKNSQMNKATINPYYAGGAVDKIMQILSSTSWSDVKVFNDLDF